MAEGGGGHEVGAVGEDGSEDCDVESERATADRVGFFLPCQLVFTVAVVGYE
jgi:hypothetical protein